MTKSNICPVCNSKWVNHTVLEAKQCGQKYAIEMIMKALDEVD